MVIYIDMNLKWIRHPTKNWCDRLLLNLVVTSCFCSCTCSQSSNRNLKNYHWKWQETKNYKAHAHVCKIVTVCTIYVEHATNIKPIKFLHHRERFSFFLFVYSFWNYAIVYLFFGAFSGFFADSPSLLHSIYSKIFISTCIWENIENEMVVPRRILLHWLRSKEISCEFSCRN